MTALQVAATCCALPLLLWLAAGAVVTLRGWRAAREWPEVERPEWDADAVARVVGRGR